MPAVVAPTRISIRTTSRECRRNKPTRRKGVEADEPTTAGVKLFSFLSTQSPCRVVALSFRQLPIAINGEAVPVFFLSPGPSDGEPPDAIRVPQTEDMPPV